MMIEVIDRVPTYPGRVKLTPVEGKENTFDMVRADAPIEAGTPINKALFDSVREELTALQHNMSDLINAHAQKATISSVPAGTEFVLYEDGIRVPFIKLAGEYGGTSRNLVRRKNIYKVESLATGAQSNVYTNCKTDAWLNSEVDGYISKFDSLTKAALGDVPVIVAKGRGSSVLETIYRKSFLLSATECGINYTGTHATEGAPVAYFNSYARKVAQYNGAAFAYWLRSPQIGTPTYNGCIDASGQQMLRDTTLENACGILPALTLPSDFEVDLSVPNTANTVATAEVI